ncbi:MAG: hypothetical protein ACXV7J_12925 [Methylomonas sp.]
MKVKNIPIGFLAVLDEQVLEELVHDNHEAECSVSKPSLYKVSDREHDQDSRGLVTLDRINSGTQSQKVSDLRHEPAQSRRLGFSSKGAITEETRTRSVLVSTTDMRLARDIGAAVRRAQSELDNQQQKGLRVIWGHC